MFSRDCQLERTIPLVSTDLLHPTIPLVSTDLLHPTIPLVSTDLLHPTIPLVSTEPLVRIFAEKCVISPDGRHIATYKRDVGWKLALFHRGKVIWEIEADAPRTIVRTSKPIFSQDGAYFVIDAPINETTSCTQIFSIKLRAKVWFHTYRGTITKLQMSPDNTFITFDLEYLEHEIVRVYYPVNTVVVDATRRALRQIPSMCDHHVQLCCDYTVHEWCMPPTPQNGDQADSTVHTV